SLTVNAIDGARFEVNLVPHTLAATALGDLSAGTRVNLEVDLLARYLERLVLGEGASRSGSSITREFLVRNGFIRTSD
ncbi:MAG: riboflavin synthase, partial [Gammaproteobacteria bacterium]|nr:riboflavin synthase [Gammaproteobacteria bacterium]